MRSVMAAQAPSASTTSCSSETTAPALMADRVSAGMVRRRPGVLCAAFRHSGETGVPARLSGLAGPTGSSVSISCGTSQQVICIHHRGWRASRSSCRRVQQPKFHSVIYKQLVELESRTLARQHIRSNV